VPQSPSLYGTLDRTLGHRRRFRKRELEQLLSEHGFIVEKVFDANRIGAPAWWLFGRVLRRRQINRVTLKLFDKTVWFWRRVDPLMPWRGLTLIAIARRPE